MTISGRAACAQCGTVITSSILGRHRQYCSNACRTAAYRIRHALESRIWEGTAIQRRPADGYVNATAMCQAGGKLWKNYHQNDRTQSYIAALAASMAENRCGAAVAGNPANLIHGSAGNPANLIQSTVTGPNHLRGTWIHPRLAVDLARWISPAFAVWMDGWFLEWTQTKQSPAPAPRQLQDPWPTDWIRHADLLASMVRRCEAGENTAITPAIIAEAAHQLAMHYRPIAIAAQLQPIAALMHEAATRLSRVAI